MSERKERPILFSAPMVRAILDGTKTQTRRAVKRVTQGDHGGCIKDVDGLPSRLDLAPKNWDICPYGSPGDFLRVRETAWERPERTERMMRDGADTWPPYIYDADYWPAGIPSDESEELKRQGWRRRPSIHLPRLGSRIKIEITETRVQRLQDISNADAIAEGLFQDQAGRWMTWSATEKRREHLSPVEAYRELWESINGPDSWDQNPWVWVVAFKREPA